MHVTDSNLKLLIDVVVLALDDDLDDLGDDLDVRRVMEDRDEVKRAWALKDLLGLLREESKARRGAKDRLEGMARGGRGEGEEKEGARWEAEDLRGKVQAFPRDFVVESALRFDRGEGPEKGGDDVKRVEDADDSITSSCALDALSESVRSLRLEVGDLRASLMGFADWARPTLVRLRGKVDGLERESSEWISELERRMEVLSDDVGKLGRRFEEHSGSSEVKH